MIRRLSAEELACTPPRPLDAAGDDLERKRAAAIVHGLHDFLRVELGLSADHVLALELALERALMLSLGASP